MCLCLLYSTYDDAIERLEYSLFLSQEQFVREPIPHMVVALFGLGSACCHFQLHEMMQHQYNILLLNPGLSRATMTKGLYYSMWIAILVDGSPISGDTKVSLPNGIMSSISEFRIKFVSWSSGKVFWLGWGLGTILTRRKASRFRLSSWS